MSADPGEQHNLAAAHPEIVKELTALLQKQIDQGRSTAGPAQKTMLESWCVSRQPELAPKRQKATELDRLADRPVLRAVNVLRPNPDADESRWNPATPASVAANARSTAPGRWLCFRERGSEFVFE